MIHVIFTMLINKINKVIRIIILILLIILAINVFYFKFSNCDKCSFLINNIKVNTNELANMYFDRCYNEKTINLSKLNLPFQVQQP